MVIRLTTNTSLHKTISRLDAMRKADFELLLRNYGDRGVSLLSAATPKDSGATAASWAYRLDKRSNSTRIVWYNTHVSDGAVIALLIQFGHGTGTGGYISGTDYINKPMRELAESLNADVRKVVTRNG